MCPATAHKARFGCIQIALYISYCSNDSEVLGLISGAI